MLYTPSADPNNRIVPISNLNLHDFRRKTQVDEIKSWFTHDLGDGYSSDVSQTKYVCASSDNDIYIEGLLHDKWGIPVGDFERTVEHSVEGIIVSHEGFDVYRNYQNQGVGGLFVRRCLRKYEKAGVDRVYMQAGDTIGGYAWARMGFRINSGDYYDSRHSVIEWMLRRVEKETDHALDDGFLSRGEHREVKLEIAKLREQSSNGQDIQPRHVSQIGENSCTWKDFDGKLYWSGKKGLLSCATWDAVYYFDGRNQ